MSKVNRVVIVVFDGLRPDRIAGLMPNLEAFAEESLWFTEARSVFPSMTRVATTSFATGDWPARHGIVNNAFHRPQIVKGEPLDTSNFDHLARLKAAEEAVVTTTSLGQALARAGLRMGAVHCGSAGSAYLVNHKVASNGQWTFSVYGEAATQTPEAVREAIARCGPLPGHAVPKYETLSYAARAFSEMALGPDGPDVALMWLPEPDTTYHQFGIGSAQAQAVTRAADDVFGMVLEQVAKHDGRTAVIAMSDHGQITTTFQTDITAGMQAAGLPASHRPDDTHRLALTRGNMGEVRSLDGDHGLIEAAGAWLMSRDDIGMVFARDDIADSLPGTLPMSVVNQGHPRAPELFFLMRASDAPDRHGVKGTCGLIAGVPLGGGMHGGLNRHELKTTLIMRTPGGRPGKDPCPAALVDIAPTVCDLLDVPFEATGRILPLFEPDKATVGTETLSNGCGAFRQFLHRIHVGNAILIDHGGRAPETGPLPTV